VGGQTQHSSGVGVEMGAERAARRSGLDRSGRPRASSGGARKGARARGSAAPAARRGMGSEPPARRQGAGAAAGRAQAERSVSLGRCTPAQVAFHWES
jgi:hypothetical protein